MTNNPTFFQEIWSRKVPQYLGTYLAVGFGLLQFIEFVSKRFGLDDFWVDGYLLLWLVLLPAVSLLIYHQGMPPPGRGSRWKRWLVFSNLLLVVVLLIFLPTRSASGEATQTVNTTDETGNTTRRTIPTASAVQRIAIFEFLNGKDDPESDWWGTAYSQLLNDDLRQRPEILVKSVLALNRYYNKFEVPLFSRINLATQRKIAERANTDYFVRAEYKVGEDSHEISGGLYRTRDGKMVQTLNTTSDNAFSATDNIKEQIYSFLPPPVVMDEKTTDLPVAALITDNQEALEYYAKGSIAFSRNPGDLPPAVENFRKSVNADPSCAPCLYSLADKLFGQGKTDTALTMITKATKLAEVLPEREQFGYKSTLLTISGAYENNIRLMEAARSLYPYEYWPYASLETYYETTYGIDSAIFLMNQAALLSDREVALIRLSGLYVKSGQFQKAEEVIKELDENYADKEETLRRYADFYRRSGQIDKARSTLKDMMATDPTNLDLPIQLADLEIQAGYYDKADKLISDVFKRSTSRADSTSAWNYRIRTYAESGQIRKALNDLEAYEKYISQDAPVNRILFADYMTKMAYADRLEDPVLIKEKYTEELEQYNYDYLAAYKCYALIYGVIKGREDPNIENKLAPCTGLLSGLGAAAIEMERMARLLIAEDYDEASNMVDERLANGTEVMDPANYVRIQRLAGRTDRALELLEDKLKIQPNDPRMLLEKVRILMIKNEPDPARKILESVLETWKDADADHTGHLEALSIAQELGLVTEG